MKKTAIFLLLAMTVSLAGCDKYGGGGYLSRAMGDWAQVNVPDGCVVKQIAAEESSGVVILCEDGRVFH